MKDLKQFIIVEIVLILIKAVAGFLCHSYTFLASSFYEFFLLFISIVTLKDRKNKKYKSIISSFTSFLFFMGSLSIVFISFIDNIQYPSWFLILFLLLCLLVRYTVCCFTTNINYTKKKGILTFSGITSTMDFFLYGIMLCSLILSKLSSHISILRYADRVGVCLIFILLFIRIFSIIRRSFTRLHEEDYILDASILKEVEKSKEVDKLHSVHVSEMGGIRFIKVHLLLKNSLAIMDLNSFIITLQDYLLKYGDVVGIYLLDKEKMKKKVRSKKEDARNSRSRNSKTNPKRKNPSQKNKKH